MVSVNVSTTLGEQIVKNVCHFSTIDLGCQLEVDKQTSVVDVNVIIMRDLVDSIRVCLRAQMDRRVVFVTIVSIIRRVTIVKNVK
jgi:hypothetical protein